MYGRCVDVFKEKNLPFRTYFVKDVNQLGCVHEEVELIWVLRGEAQITVDNSHFVATDRTLFIVNSKQFHSLKSSNESTIVVFQFKQDYLDSQGITFENLRFCNRIYEFSELVEKYREVPLLISQMIQLLLEDGENKMTRFKIIGFYNLFVYELHTLLRKEKYLDLKGKDVDKHLHRIRVVLNFINENFRRKVSLDEISDLIGISRYRLSHFVKEDLGINFQDYLNHVRMEYALKELRDSDLSVINIAKNCGFSDIKYLNKLLKERYKLTALKYRKLITERSKIKSNCVECHDEFRIELKKTLTELNIN